MIQEWMQLEHNTELYKGLSSHNCHLFTQQLYIDVKTGVETVPNPTELHIIGVKSENSHTQLTLTCIGPIERKRTRTLILPTPPHAANLERYRG